MSKAEMKRLEDASLEELSKTLKSMRKKNETYDDMEETVEWTMMRKLVEKMIENGLLAEGKWKLHISGINGSRWLLESRCVRQFELTKLCHELFGYFPEKIQLYLKRRRHSTIDLEIKDDMYVIEFFDVDDEDVVDFLNTFKIEIDKWTFDDCAGLIKEQQNMCNLFKKHVEKSV